MNSPLSFNQQSTTEQAQNRSSCLTKLLLGLLLVVSLVGFADATYLTVKHFAGEIPACSILEGCEEVTTSVYSTIFGIPVALLGSIFYFIIFGLSMLLVDLSMHATDMSDRIRAIVKLIARLTTLGFLATIWFLFAQAFLIKALCLYCLISAATSTTLFVLGLILLKRCTTERRGIQ